MRPLAALGRYINPVVRRIAPYVPPLAVVHHVGRRSGRAYRAPVQACPTSRGRVVALVYGADVDWLRNVTRAGRAEPVTRRRRYRIDEPRFLHGTDGARLLPDRSRRAMRFLRVTEFTEFVEFAASPVPGAEHLAA